MRWEAEGRPVEVVLDEGADDGPGPGPGASDGPGDAGDPRTPGTRTRRRVAVAVLLAVVAVLGLVDARTERRERDALAAAAHVPGVLRSLDEPLAEVWRLPAFPPLATAGGVVVAADEPDLVGLDLASGEQRWRWSRPAGSRRPACPWPLPGEGGATRVLCFGLDRTGPAAGHGLRVLDPRTGLVGARVGGGVGGGRLVLTLAAVDGDVVALEGARSGLLVTRHDVEADRERWSVAVDRGDVGFGELRVHGDERVVVVEGATSVVLDARDGRELGRWVAVSDGVAPAVARVVSHPGRGFGVWTSRFAGRWYGPDGTPGPSLAGEPVAPEVDDGTRPGVVLLRPADGERLRAVDVTTGRRLWDRPSPTRVLLHLAGRLVVTGHGRLEGWDPVTGEVVWSVPLDAGENPDLGGPYTDGVRVLVRGEDADGLRLTARRIRDGDVAWRAPLPAGSEYLTVLGDRLAAVRRVDGGSESAAVLG